MAATTFVPLDFNSLCRARHDRLALSPYYLDYAFHREGLELLDGMRVTFYDLGWLDEENGMVCIDAVLGQHPADGAWTAKLTGRIYSATGPPERTYFSAFIGAGTGRLVEAPDDPDRLGSDPGQDHLTGLDVFLLAADSALPEFSAIVGMTPAELFDFSRFPTVKGAVFVDGEPRADSKAVRGGGNGSASWPKRRP